VGEHPLRRRAIFLDRDGVLNRPIIRDRRPFSPSTLDEFTLYPDVVDVCLRLKTANFLLIVVTNQPDVGRGIQERTIVEAIHHQLKTTIPWIDRIEVCYHAGERYDAPCACRKPKPGMLIHAAKEMGIDLAASYFIGDRWRDVDCAYAAGCRSVFIDRGYDEKLRKAPDFIVSSFAQAADAVLCDARSALHSSRHRPAE